MTESVDLQTALLQRLDIVVLERVGAYSYNVVGELPKFYREHFADEPDGQPCVAPWKHSMMLESFVEEMEDFAADETQDCIASGIWQEEALGNAELALAAQGLRINGSIVLIIRNISSDYPNHMVMLQKARENVLAQKSLHRSLTFYKQRSSYDSLTALYNRETFLELMRTGVKQAMIAEQPLAVIMVDIDNFKVINDTYGHLVGDDVLRSLGAIFNEILRKQDIAARYGGEEFIICAFATTLEQAGFLAEKVRSSVEAHTFEVVPAVTVSLGVTIYKIGDTLDDCIRRADLALYDAKHMGKNRVCFSS